MDGISQDFFLQNVHSEQKCGVVLKQHRCTILLADLEKPNNVAVRMFTSFKISEMNPFKPSNVNTS